MMTLLALYHDAVNRLSTAGIPDSDTEAVILLRHVLNCKRADIFLQGRQEVAGDALAAVERILTRRLTREPLAYILGEQEFYGKNFIVTPAVLIPRQETELLIDRATSTLNALSDDDQNINAIDFGTGSGVIAITLALQHPQVSVLAVDRSIIALRVAQRNALRHGVSARLSWLNSDWGGALKSGSRFHLVAANPPYVARRDQHNLQPELTAEPEMALFAGDDGREEIVRIISDSSRLLLPGGILLMEIGYDQESFVLAAIADTQAFSQAVVHRDYARLPRLLEARRQKKTH